MPDDLHRIDFYFKFLPAPDGKGFDDEPALVYCHRDETTRSRPGSTARSTLRESRFDPVADLPVRRLVEPDPGRAAQRADGARSSAGCRASGSLPFAHQRYDDLSPVGDD